MIKAKIIADSLNGITKDRLTTFILTYPRYIHAEVMTHRMFSRNAASSRAILMHRFRDEVMENPAMPAYWGSNQPGMQAGLELDDEAATWNWGAAEQPVTQREFAKRTWLAARDLMVGAHTALGHVGLHKQIANRVLEPWFHIRVIVSATEFKNWFALRCHKDAHPDIQALADAMLELYVTHEPKMLGAGEWHLPFSDRFLDPNLPFADQLKVCVARVARISYMTHDGETNIAKDIKLHDRLVQNGHWSPFEHLAEAVRFGTWSGNFRGFKQYRKMCPGECQDIVDLKAFWEARKKERGMVSLIPA